MELPFGWGHSDHISLLDTDIPATYILRMDEPRWGNLLQRLVRRHSIPSRIHMPLDRPDGVDGEQMAEVIDLTYHSTKEEYSRAAAERA